MSEWVNLGDINPEQGTLLIRNARVEDGDFFADVVVVIPESDVDGSDRIFDLIQGDLFLAGKAFVSRSLNHH